MKQRNRPKPTLPAIFSHSGISARHFLSRQNGIAPVFHFSFFIFLFSLIFNLTSCVKSTEPLYEHGKVKLIAETTAASFLRMKLEITTEQKYDAFKVERDGHTVRESTITGTDTVFYDGGLEPQSAYNYKAFLLRKGHMVDTSRSMTVNTTAATSHEFTWRVDTLGDYGSILRDVAVISPTDVWAVGNLEMDPTGTGERYTAVHWDGSNFDYYEVAFVGYGGVIYYPYIRAVHAFSANDVWFFPNLDSYAHFDGDNWTTGHQGFGLINDVWGESSSDFYCVGEDGAIVHYDGSQFTKMESGTTEDLYDIKGIVDPESGKLYLWAIGLRTLLVYDGDSWQLVMSRGKPFFSEKYTIPRALFVSDSKNVVLSCFGGGSSILYILDYLNYKNFFPLIEHEYFAYGIAGSSLNNFIIGSHYVGIEYFNGVTIKNHPNLLGPGYIMGLGYKNGNVFLVGLSGPSDYRAIFIHGIQQ